jgi:anti-sigma B factor antagonist
MNITTKSLKHCELVSVTGRIDSATAPQLAQALDALIKNNKFKIVLDMSGVEYMSSAGLRTLLATQRQCRRYNRGEVALAAVPQNIKDTLELAGFTDIFKIYDDVISAVGSF